MKSTIYTTYEGYDIDIQLDCEKLSELKERIILLKEAGFTHKVKNVFKKQVKVTENDPCPKCGAKLVKYPTSKGDYLKCSTAKSSKGENGEWINEGCKFFQKI